MSVLDLDRLKTIANFLESQLILEGVPPVGLVQINNEEASVIVEALREYVYREYALGNDRAAEWDQLRGFYRRHGMGAKAVPKCLICTRTFPAAIIRPKELPNIVVCDVCRSKALTADIEIKTDEDGRAVSILRIDEDGHPIGVMWRFNTAVPIKREERVHDFDD